MTPDPHFYQHTTTPDGETLTVYLPGDSPIAVSDSHPHFAGILSGAKAGDPARDLIGLADLSVAVSDRLASLSERVAVANGRVYFDGDQVDNNLTRQIVRFLDEGVNDWRPLVSFMDNLALNPQDHSRRQLFDWLSGRDFTITDDGHLIAYKGVQSGNAEGAYVSAASGGAYVDGQWIDGQVPNHVGAVVTLPRGQVTFDPAVGCSVGLHAGTFDYAQGYASGALLKVKINPRDVVSVPTDSAAAKIRVCRYEVLDTIDAPETAPVIFAESCDCGNPYCACADDEYAYDDNCGDPDCTVCGDSFGL